MRTYSIGQYEGEFYIPEFRGLMQGGDTLNADARYATDEKNVEIINGALQPMAAHITLSPALTGPIETIARLWRRWYTGPNNLQEILVAATGGKLYSMYPGFSSEWTQLAFPTGVSAYQSNDWSWVAYEINPQGSTAPIDVLILSNALDGMIMVRGDNLSVTKIDTPKKFGVIARYAERIWGGAIPDDPDMLMYSAPYDPTDWEQNEEIPEDGAGSVQQPSWDGDSFYALEPFGSQLIAFKKNRVWRVLGTDPGEYTFKEQYGGGSAYENTIAVCGEMILMVGKDGIVSYDGLNVSPFQSAALENVWRRVNKLYLSQASAVWWKHKYYLALPVDNSTYNNIVVVWDGRENTWLKYEDIYAERFLDGDETLYYTSSTAPGKITKWATDSRTNGVAMKNAKWVSPWTDLGAKNITKDSFEVYFTPEIPVGLNIKLRFTLETERRSKYKDVVIEKYPYDDPLDPAPVHETTEVRQQKIFFGGSGRRFRLIIEWLPTAQEYTPWRLTGGVLVRCSLDRD